MFRDTVRNSDVPGLPIHDTEHEAARNWAIDATPTIFLVDAEGILRFQSGDDGPPTPRELQRRIEGLLGGAK